MYELTTRSKKVEKYLYEFLASGKIAEKLALLQQNPRKMLHAHALKGRLAGLWSCYLGYDIRMV